MINACNESNSKRNDEIKIDYILDDILSTKISNASVVIMNFSLQFIALDSRKKLLKKIYDGLVPGGIFILSEKIIFDKKR